MTACFTFKRLKGNYMRQIEVLAPAGSMECLKAAILAGADAVYLGGSMFGARAYAKNLTEEEMLEAIDYVHIHGRKLYMTVNTLLKDTELHKLYDFLSPYYKQGLDGVIVQDIGVVSYLRRQFPNLPVHASTQMTLTSPYGAKLMKEQGLTRVVPARELSLKEVKEIKAETGLEVECFVHGAMCYCYSGQCLLSSMIGGRSGNRGQCAQPCRLPYSLADGKPMDLMSLKDMCTIKLIPELIEAGVDSFKIEGRMKQPGYVYTVASMYRKYVDLYFEKGREGFKVTEQDLRKLESAYKRRGYTEGYYKQHNGKQMISLKRPNQKEDLLLVPDEKCQEPITGRLLLRKGQKSKLYLKHQEFEVAVEGAVCEEAMKQPLDEDRVRKQMKKLGNTEFAMKNLELEMDLDIFLPMQELNQLRRAGVEALEKAILEPYYRSPVAKMAVLEDEKISQETILDEGTLENISGNLSSNKKLSALVRSFEQLEVVAKYKQIEEIYIESPLCYEAETVKVARKFKEDNRKVYSALPYIFRRPAIMQLKEHYRLLLEVYDGVLIRNFESLKLLGDLNYPKEIHGDYNLYIFNKLSKKWMKEAGISRSTAPVELNEKELRKLNISGCTFIGYGYQPVMITAGCIQKTSKECNKQNSKLFIKDRYRKEFFVQMCCDYCYNVIYNTARLYLADQSALLKGLKPQRLRLDFSFEKPGEVRNIIEAYDSAISQGVDVKISGEFTRGHIKRGVK